VGGGEGARITMERVANSVFSCCMQEEEHIMVKEKSTGTLGVASSTNSTQATLLHSSISIWWLTPQKSINLNLNISTVAPKDDT